MCDKKAALDAVARAHLFRLIEYAQLIQILERMIFCFDLMSMEKNLLKNEG